MFSLKKDCFFEAKMSYLVIFGFHLAFLLFGSLSLSFPFDQEKISLMYRQVYITMSVISICYPIYVLQAMSPKVNFYFNKPQITMHLPCSKKELFYKGLKPWFILLLIHFIGSTMILYYLNVYLFGENLVVLWNEVISILIYLVIFMAAMVLQILTISIKGLSNQSKWYKLIVIYIVGNISFLFISLIVMIALGEQMKLMIVPLLGLLLISAIIFSKNFNRIEKIYQ